MNTTRTTRNTIVMATAALATLTTITAGCTAVDRAGGTAGQHVTTLHFAQENDGPPAEQLQAWADQVEKDSEGSLKVSFDNGYRLGDPHVEAAVIDDVKAGKVDLGWVGARAFDDVGVTTFQALLAPMLVDSQDLQAAVFEKGIPQEMLAGVDDAGVHGVAVLPGPMRKVLGVDHPFLEPADFKGETIGIQESALTTETFATLGAVTRALPSGADISGVDGYEQQLSSIYGNGYDATAGYVTANLDLWPRPLVVIVNQDTYDSLTAAQRQVLDKAAGKVMGQALDVARTDDASGMDGLCRTSMDFPEASQNQLDALTHALAPVYKRILHDATSAPWFKRILALKQQVGAAPDTMRCAVRGDKPVTDRVAGDYRATIDWPHVDVPQECKPGSPEGDRTSVYVLHLTDGDVSMDVQPGGTGDPVTAYRGSYRVFRDQLELSDGVPLTAHFTVDQNALVLTSMTGGSCGDAAVWTSSPWVREPTGAASVDALDGTWVTELTASDWQQAGLPGPAGQFTLTFDHGIVTVTDPDGGMGFRAQYDTFRDRLVTKGGPDVLRVTYRVDGDALELSDLDVAGSDEPNPYTVVWTTHPFERQG
jgi:TRAP-type C4-dicarboxylate transport system substrate-binding protein